MENLGLYEDIAKRTDGDIYVGVVGPVRTGKSTFIKNFMDLLVIPNIDNEYKKERAQDELPQSAAGKTIMTTEPKFVPNEAIDITIDEKLKLKTRLVDCVGYLIPNSIGYLEDDKPRMVKTPWSEDEMPFEQAAEIGTKKVIEEHSTIGILITTDGSITEIPREDYIQAEERVVSELKAINKPFVILLNSEHPESQETRNLASTLSEKYSSTVIPINCVNLSMNDITNIFSSILYEFPVSQINFKFPAWVNGLDLDHSLKVELFKEIKDAFGNVTILREITPSANKIAETEIISRTKKQLKDYDLPLNEKKFYIKKYGYLPISSYIKTLSFGLVRDLYFISKPNDKDHIRRNITNKNISSRDLETILEFLVKIRNICCHNEILLSFMNEQDTIPDTNYHKYFVINNIQYGKKDFLATLISIKLLIDNNKFKDLINDIDKLINKTYKSLKIPKERLLYFMHLPSNYNDIVNL